MASSPPRPRRPMAASSTTSSSSVIVLTADDLLDTATSATVDSRTRWPEAGRTKSTLVLSKKKKSTLVVDFDIPEHYALLNAGYWVACDVPPEGYNVICAYTAAFRAGMRLPLHDLHAAVLRQYGLAPSQLMPNAWRYLNAFVLLCGDAGVQPTLPLFQSFFVICAEKGESMGRFHFKPYRYPLSPPDPDSGSSGRRRRGLFTGRMPQSTWKDRFFFIRGPSGLPWPCSMRWGTPSKESIKEPVLTNDTTEAIHKLVHLAGDTGIDLMKLLSKRDPPVGQQQIPAAVTPLPVAVKQEPNAAAAACTTEQQTRKRKSPEPGYDDLSTPAGVGLGLGEVDTAARSSRLSIDLMAFLSGSSLPVGSWSESTPRRRKRSKSFQVATRVPDVPAAACGSQPQQRNAGMSTPQGSSLVGQRQCSSNALGNDGSAMERLIADLKEKEKELQASKAEVAKLNQEHAAVVAKLRQEHAGEVARLKQVADARKNMLQKLCSLQQEILRAMEIDQ